MAELKLYSCDICTDQNAIHIEIPDVDSGAPDWRGDCSPLAGKIDLCPKCLPKQISHAIEKISWDQWETGQELRRKFWKELFKK